MGNSELREGNIVGTPFITPENALFRIYFMKRGEGGSLLLPICYTTGSVRLLALSLLKTNELPCITSLFLCGNVLKLFIRVQFTVTIFSYKTLQFRILSYCLQMLKLFYIFV